MNDLLARVIAAHGGLERWNTFNKVTATVVAGGRLRTMKGLEADTTPRERTVTLHEETTYISPFGQPDWRMAFTPDRVAIETSTGAVVSERSNPRACGPQETRMTDHLCWESDENSRRTRREPIVIVQPVQYRFGHDRSARAQGMPMRSQRRRHTPCRIGYPWP